MPPGGRGLAGSIVALIVSRRSKQSVSSLTSPFSLARQHEAQGSNYVESMDPRVPVLKAAVSLNKECLWKEQVGLYWWQ